MFSHSVNTFCKRWGRWAAERGHAADSEPPWSWAQEARICQRETSHVGPLTAFLFTCQGPGDIQFQRDVTPGDVCQEQQVPVAARPAADRAGPAARVCPSLHAALTASLPAAQSVSRGTSHHGAGVGAVCWDTWTTEAHLWPKTTKPMLSPRCADETRRGSSSHCFRLVPHSCSLLPARYELMF